MAIGHAGRHLKSANPCKVTQWEWGLSQAFCAAGCTHIMPAWLMSTEPMHTPLHPASPSAIPARPLPPEPHLRPLPLAHHLVSQPLRQRSTPWPTAIQHHCLHLLTQQRLTLQLLQRKDIKLTQQLSPQLKRELAQTSVVLGQTSGQTLGICPSQVLAGVHS